MVRTALVMTWLLTHHIHQEACTGGNCRPLLDERPTSSSTLVRSSDTGTRPSARPWRLSKQHVSPARRRARSRVWPRRRVRLVAGPRSSVVAGATADGRDCAQKRERATLPHWRRAGAARGRRRRARAHASTLPRPPTSTERQSAPRPVLVPWLPSSSPASLLQSSLPSRLRPFSAPIVSSWRR